MWRECILGLNGRETFGRIVPHPDGLRFRVWTREWEELGLGGGAVVAVQLPHAAEVLLLISSVVSLPDTGNSWVHFVPYSA
jgi:hypothetical protein